MGQRETQLDGFNRLMQEGRKQIRAPGGKSFCSVTAHVLSYFIYWRSMHFSMPKLCWRKTSYTTLSELSASCFGDLQVDWFLETGLHEVETFSRDGTRSFHLNRSWRTLVPWWHVCIGILSLNWFFMSFLLNTKRLKSFDLQITNKVITAMRLNEGKY